MPRNCGATRDPLPSDVEGTAETRTAAQAAGVCEDTVVGTNKKSGAAVQNGTSAPLPK